MELFALLVFAHMLADYPLQGEFLARGKNHKSPIPGIPFAHPLAAHSIIHGGFVGVITGSLLLAVMETLIHAATDWAKCDGRISYHTDQAIHIGCKLIWTATYFWILT